APVIAPGAADAGASRSVPLPVRVVAGLGEAVGLGALVGVERERLVVVLGAHEVARVAADDAVLRVVGEAEGVADLVGQGVLLGALGEVDPAGLLAADGLAAGAVRRADAAGEDDLERVAGVLRQAAHLGQVGLHRVVVVADVA